MGNTFSLGIDVGSVSVKLVVIDESRRIIEKRYIRSKGRPLSVLKEAIMKISEKIPEERIGLVSVTGSGSKFVADLFGGISINEVIAQAKATQQLYPEVRTIIEIGGEDSKLILLKEGHGRSAIEDFSMNSVCAAGTGSFLDQQASRLNLTIEEFGDLALKSKSPPRIAGRCSVFAKSDMIHLQQIATPDYDIVAGLCFAVARNFISTIGRGKVFKRPISFCGGVAANKGMRRAFEELLELKEGEFIIPKEFPLMGAIGAILLALEEGHDNRFLGFERLLSYTGGGGESKLGLESLSNASCCTTERFTGDGGQGPGVRSEESEVRIQDSESKQRAESSVGRGRLHPAMPVEGDGRSPKIDAYLGIDVGSISTNLVVIDKNKRVISKRYIMTAGRPIEAVKNGLKDIGSEIGGVVNIMGVGTTGSGRYLIGDMVGADIIRNEITAQATAAINIDQDVDTIFEIGGQDSKYISIDNGVVIDFEMNKACAAGTGSFLEEQAERLGISIKDEFGNLALSTKSPCSLGEKCTVFMESDLVHHQQRGAKTDELVGGLSYSIVHNYLNRVVCDRRIGDRLLFQGGVAANKGVVAAFEKVTGKKIVVPEHHEVTGAIGVAILAMESNTKASRFKGFDIAQKGYEITIFECRDCSNRCEVRRVYQEGEEPLYYGGRCEKYEIKGRSKEADIPDLYAEREKILLRSSARRRNLPSGAPTVGIPKALFFYELLPFWKTFFNELGFKVVVSESTNKEIIRNGLEKVVVETCFPIKVAHGHIISLLERGVDFLFVPSFLDLNSDINDNGNPDPGKTCPYIQAFPYMMHSAIDMRGHKTKFISAPIHLGQGRNTLKKELKVVLGMLGRSKADINGALDAALHAQDQFYGEIKKRGKEIIASLSEDQVAMVIVSRSYNGCDPAINLGIPKKLKDLGIISIPMDFLPLEGEMLDDDSYWISGKRILRAGILTKPDSRLYPLYITNYGCGPDSFISHFFRDMLKGKPYLQIEVDEHSGDAGIVTRCEAFLDSLKGVKLNGIGLHRKRKAQSDSSNGKMRRIYIPYMADHAFAIAAAFEAHGIPAKVLPNPDMESLKIGRKYTSGRECYPAILTAGDLGRMISDPKFEPEHSAFMMPSGCGPCRFGQYHRLHRIILNEMGYPQIPIISPNQDEKLYSEIGRIGNKFISYCWQGIVAIDRLEKRAREIRPYERITGETDKVYWDSIQRVYDTIKKREDIYDALSWASNKLDQVEVKGPYDKPIIGLVGEIYIRSNRFSNEDIIRKIERLGGEVWMPPMGEWFYYLNFTSKIRSLSSSHYRDFIRVYITDIIQRHKEDRLGKAFKRSMRDHGEPSLESIVENARPYIHESFEGEAILSVGKSIDFIKKGASGMINVMPLTCMPGTIANAVLKRVREDNGGIPFLNISYDGQEETNNQTRLEAFMHQAYQFKNRAKV